MLALLGSRMTRSEFQELLDCIPIKLLKGNEIAADEEKMTVYTHSSIHATTLGHANCFLTCQIFILVGLTELTAMQAYMVATKASSVARSLKLSNVDLG